MDSISNALTCLEKKGGEFKEENVKPVQIEKVSVIFFAGTFQQDLFSVSTIFFNLLESQKRPKRIKTTKKRMHLARLKVFRVVYFLYWILTA